MVNKRDAGRGRASRRRRAAARPAGGSRRAALSGKIARDVEARSACQLLDGYGLTETASLGTLHCGGTPSSLGTPVPRTLAAFRDDAGADR